MCATCGCSTPAPGRPGGASAPIDHDQGHAHAHAHPHPHPHPHPPGPDGRARALVTLEEEVLARNAGIADENRRWLAARGILALNLVSAPGAGKTTLLERTIRDVGRQLGIHVIEGDQATDHDAARIRAAGAPALQINTGTVCHLDAAMIGRALPGLDLAPGSVLVIENVGNLVCPALFDLGEHAKVVLTSVPEGDDKPLKYPHMFRASDVMLLNKIDLLPFVSFDTARCVGYARQIHAGIQVFEISATRGDGLAAWYGWLERARAAVRAPRRGPAGAPAG